MIAGILSYITKGGLMIVCAAAVLVAFLFLVYAAVYENIRNPDVVNILTGQTMTLVSGIVGYYFGSSKGSADKTALMADKLEK